MNNRYYINFDKSVNRLLQYYLRGYKTVFLLQSLLKPLQSLNNSFLEWATEMRLQATMTSQVIRLEWYLNRQLSKYFLDNSQKISIQDTESIGVPIYWEDAVIDEEEKIFVRQQSESATDTLVLRKMSEITGNNLASFIVYSPAINTELISKEQYTQILSFIIDKYKLAGKTYIIKINERV